MPHQVLPIAAIEAKARTDAATYDNVNDACPYSFYTEAGRVYKAAFQKERLAMSMKGKPEVKTNRTRAAA
ncbi:hypothetical protein AEP_00545 [Curvibacter sp. AEP1-3]|uniref:hypothetical protein n=1 Tax=Curvibacter sp. AEP1-3 TaxID=1844971 RepID=UPI000B3D05EE|nr:hypothetical protein [Curvibacter sp. AEP1-3]ARV17505.1 hypothetical protein AEP_00545 [Curvibacter sp. AEP1-3]